MNGREIKGGDIITLLGGNRAIVKSDVLKKFNQRSINDDNKFSIADYCWFIFSRRLLSSWIIWTENALK